VLCEPAETLCVCWVSLSLQDESAGLIQEKEATDSDALGLSFESFMKGVKTQAPPKTH